MQRVNDTDVPNHLVMHTSQFNTYVSVWEEVHNTMLTRTAVINTAQPMDIGALDNEQGKGKKGDKARGKEKCEQPSGKPMRESE